MQDAGDELLSRPAFAPDQHRRLAAGHLADGLQHAVDGRALPLQLAAVEVAGLGGRLGRRRVLKLRKLRLQDGDLPRLRFDPFDLPDQLFVEPFQIAVALDGVESHVRDLPQRVQEREILAAERGRVLFRPQHHQPHGLVADLESVHQVDAQLAQRILDGRRFTPRAQQGALQVSQLLDGLDQGVVLGELARQAFGAISRDEAEGRFRRGAQIEGGPIDAQDVAARAEHQLRDGFGIRKMAHRPVHPFQCLAELIFLAVEAAVDHALEHVAQPQQQDHRQHQHDRNQRRLLRQRKDVEILPRDGPQRNRQGKGGRQTAARQVVHHPFADDLVDEQQAIADDAVGVSDRKTEPRQEDGKPRPSHRKLFALEESQIQHHDHAEGRQQPGPP